MTRASLSGCAVRSTISNARFTKQPSEVAPSDVSYNWGPLLHLGFPARNGIDALRSMRHGRAVHDQEGYALHHAVLHHPGDPDQRRGRAAGMPGLQNEVSERTLSPGHHFA